MLAKCSHCGYETETSVGEGETLLCPMCDTVVKARRASELESVELRYPGRRVLVVEDSRGVRAMLKDVLEEAGFSVTAAGDGEAALAILRRERPDVVLLDLKLPKMDGFAFLREARALPEAAGVPILVTSALHQSPEDMQKLRELGAAGFIVKDCLFDTVLDRVHAAAAKAA